MSPRDSFDFDHRMCDIAIRERVVESGQNAGLPRTWGADHDNRKHLRSLPGRAEASWHKHGLLGQCSGVHPESAGIQRRPAVLAEQTLSERPGGVGASQQRQMPVPVVHAENPRSSEVDVGLRDVESPAEASHGLDMLGQHGIG